MTLCKIPKVFWLWFPIISAALFLLCEFVIDREQYSQMLSENGIVELLQFAIIFPAFLIAAYTFRYISFKQTPYLALWMGLAALGSLYVAGEEVSWGQHFLGWATPEGWLHINDQGETNLHNTSHLLDQLPRSILEVGVIVGGLIIPALQRYKPGLLPQKFAIIYPPAILAVTAAAYTAYKIGDTINDATDARFFTRVSEIREVYVYYFVLLYVWVMKTRLKDLRDTRAE